MFRSRSAIAINLRSIATSFPFASISRAEKKCSSIITFVNGNSHNNNNNNTVKSPKMTEIEIKLRLPSRQEHEQVNIKNEVSIHHKYKYFKRFRITDVHSFFFLLLLLLILLLFINYFIHNELISYIFSGSSIILVWIYNNTSSGELLL